MDTTEFKPGDIVQVKSGGPIMTVEKVGKTAMFDEESVWCVWFEKVGNKQVAQRETFVPTVLNKAEKPSGPFYVGVHRA